ncbi:sigma-70 family RNA polymerase sigma factor [Nonomuraea angiospora]|uniref:sigma-70 family RNA polymerase sigma factor n=1 Tax=Nonomuraea angiospora TaxID=46172 RepID=UPI00340E4FA5
MTEGRMCEDAELTQRVRAGDSHAVAELYERHHAAVLAFARRLSPDPQAAEDLASEAFTRTLRTVRTGAGGPSGGWRPYLYAVVRNTAAEWARTDQRLVLIGEFRADEFADLLVTEPEVPDDLVVRAFRSLPPRWQTVLRHTLIEEEEPERVARILGITPGNVSVLAFRAREGLRKAYLAAHVVAGSPECQSFADRMATVVRKPSGRIPRALRAHLDVCPSCARAFAELRDLNSTLRAALPIVLLPLAVGKATASKGAAIGMTGWAIPVTAAVAVVAATAAVVLTLPPDPQLPAASPPQASAASTWRAVPSSTPTPKSTSKQKDTLKPTAGSTVRTAPRTRITDVDRCTGRAGGQVTARSCTTPRHPRKTATAPPGPTTLDIDPVTTSALRNVGTRLCLDVPEGSRNNVGQIWVYSCNGASAQLWTRTPSGQITVYDGQKCLDALEQGKTDGTAVGIRDCQGGDNQKWTLNADGTIRGVGSGLCLDVDVPTSRVQLWSCHDGDNQRWQAV